jgi:flagellar hook-length control protein FliK
MLPVSSSIALRHVKDTSIESRGNIQAPEASDFSKLLAAEVSGDEEVRDTGTSERQAGPAANAAGNGLVIPGSPSPKDSEDTDSRTETEEGLSGTEGNMTTETLAGGFQLSGPATITARPDITYALHVPIVGRTSDTVTGNETRTPADTMVQQQPDAASGRMSGGANIAVSSATDAYDPHLSAAGRIISSTRSIASGQAEADTRPSDLSRPAVGENTASVAQGISPGMYLNPAVAGGSQEGKAAVRTASFGVVSATAIGVKLPQDTKFTGTARHEAPHSDSASSGGRLAGIPGSVGELLPDFPHLHPASHASESDTSSLPTLAASVVPHELLSPSQSSGHLRAEPGIVLGSADLPDPSSLRLEPRLGTGSWDNALSQKVLWMVSQQHQIAELNLNPPDLGPLQVVLSVNSDQASAAFVSQNPEVRQALEAALPRLKEMMAESGINLGNATVSDQGSGQQGDFERQNGGRSYYRHGESRIVAAGTSLGMNRGTAETGGHQLVDTFA